MMPIDTMSFRGRLFFTRMVGYADHIDMRRWGKTLRKYADSSPLAIAAVVDLLDTTRICPTLLTVCEAVSVTDDILGIWLAVSVTSAAHNSLVVEALRNMPDIYVLPSIESALQAAQARLVLCPFPISGNTLQMLSWNQYS